MSVNLFTNYPLSWRPDRSQLKRPYYRSLVAQLQNAINNGEILPDTKLPPQRELADFLDLGFATVTRAYQLSQQLGLTYGIVGRGTYVAKNANGSQTISSQRMTNVQELGFNSSFEVNNHLLKATIEEVATSVNFTKFLNYDEPTGLAKQRMVASSYIDKVGMRANAQNTMIVSGSQNALMIAMLGLFKNGDKIAVDRFTYANFIELAKMTGIELIPINGDEQGMLATDLEFNCIHKLIKGIYLMPDINNPTATVLTEHRKHQLATIIDRYQLILIEDGYLNFLNLYQNPKRNRISDLVPDHSFYICSMSKSLVSGLRIGFIRMATQFRDAIENTMFNTNVKTSALDAEIVTRALQNGTANKIMHSKLQMVIKANRIFNRVFGLPNHKHDYRFFRTVRVDSSINGTQMERILMQNGIRVFHSDRFLVGRPADDSFLRISLTSIDDFTALKLALQHLKAVLIQEHFWL
ncbi:PLP-dependent aminotransferase family protein (plasmid) [Nicoliella spurrieriana]|uniref:PLP-dependent aminotransferase family protein n=1 Tax=Nicoliella spurrieriana TaxID=2925830 RepID=A0A976RQF7_9LACO|nr:PLP-dependent aminotransferase family protein [Nicoliella spurrieriana]UQS85938.1 PLP-dependent aminotransferase family protein [Nicoliella spurrieriana]